MRPSARYFRILFTAALLGAGLTGCTPRPDPGTLVLLNGVIFTGEAGFTDAQAMVINGRTITAVCKTDDWAKRYVGKETRVIDLEGRFVVPGLIDAHVDFAAAASAMFDADLAAVADENGLRKEVGRVSARLRAGDWIGGGGWIEAGDAAWRPAAAMIGLFFSIGVSDIHNIRIAIPTDANSGSWVIPAEVNGAKLRPMIRIVERIKCNGRFGDRVDAA